MDVPLVSRNDLGSSRNKRYLMNDGMNLIFKAKAKLLILYTFCEPLKDYMSIINTYREFV